MVVWRDREGVPGHLSPPASPIGHFQHWPLTSIYQCFCSGAISFLLLVSLPVSKEEPALPQPLFLPRPWRTPEQGCVRAPVSDTAGAWLGLGTGGLQKKEGWWGWTLRAAMGTCGGGRFPIPNTPFPLQCVMRRAVRACVGQWGCTGSGTSHRWELHHHNQEVEARTR